MWGKIVSSVSSALDFNQATLSGCIDIICVRDPQTGRLHSTPFHVRFGKAKLLRSREKVVTITVNNAPTSLVMKLGAAGEAHFMQEVSDESGLAEDDLASPINSPMHSPRREESSDRSPTEHMNRTHRALESVASGDLIPPSHPGREEAGQPPSLSTAASAQHSAGIASSGAVSAAPMHSTEGPITRSEEAGGALQADPSWQTAWGSATQGSFGSVEGRVLAPTGTGDASSESLAEDSRSSVQFSLCGHVLFGTEEEAQHDADVFRANLVTWETMEANPSLWYHPSMVACFDRSPPYYPVKVALPLLASWVLFGRPPSLGSVKRLMTGELAFTEHPHRAWPGWPVANSIIDTPKKVDALNSTCLDSSKMLGVYRGLPSSRSANSDTEFASFSAGDPATSNGRRFRRSLRPTSEQLESLNLKPGANSVCFTVSSSLQGQKSVCGTIYLWPTNIKIVVSDVDGTITRSDVLGQLMPIVGRDWSHTGVAELFTKIKRSGYYILYLTARAIGQADATRDYLFGLTQKERDKLPDGPLILSPDRLFPSFRREVIDRKPYIFKIAALRDIRSLFPQDRNPFYAGFGNRESDHRAYIHVGIPEAKIFIIDTAGVIHHINNSTYARTYETMSEIADYMFPPLKDSAVKATDNACEDQEEEEFNSFNFWGFTYGFPSKDDNSQGHEGHGGVDMFTSVSSRAHGLDVGGVLSGEQSTGHGGSCALTCEVGQRGPLAVPTSPFFGEGTRASPGAVVSRECFAASDGSGVSVDESSNTDSAGHCASGAANCSGGNHEQDKVFRTDFDARDIVEDLCLTPCRKCVKEAPCKQRRTSDSALSCASRLLVSDNRHLVKSRMRRSSLSPLLSSRSQLCAVQPPYTKCATWGSCMETESLDGDLHLTDGIPTCLDQNQSTHRQRRSRSSSATCRRHTSETSLAISCNLGSLHLGAKPFAFAKAATEIPEAASVTAGNFPCEQIVQPWAIKSGSAKTCEDLGNSQQSAKDEQQLDTSISSFESSNTHIFSAPTERLYGMSHVSETDRLEGKTFKGVADTDPKYILGGDSKTLHSAPSTSLDSGTDALRFGSMTGFTNLEKNRNAALLQKTAIDVFEWSSTNTIFHCLAQDAPLLKSVMDSSEANSFRRQWVVPGERRPSAAVAGAAAARGAPGLRHSPSDNFSSEGEQAGCSSFDACSASRCNSFASAVSSGRPAGDATPRQRSATTGHSGNSDVGTDAPIT